MNRTHVDADQQAPISHRAINASEMNKSGFISEMRNSMVEAVHTTSIEGRRDSGSGSLPSCRNIKQN